MPQGEEPHLAYNRVALTDYWEHRDVSSLFLQSPAWYADQLPDRFAFSTGERVTEIDPVHKNVFTSKGNTYQCVLSSLFCLFLTRRRRSRELTLVQVRHPRHRDRLERRPPALRLT